MIFLGHPVLSGYKKYLTEILSGYERYLTGRLPGYQKYLTARVPGRSEGHISRSLIISVVLLCEAITRVPIVSSVLYKVSIQHHFSGWRDPGQHAVLPVAALPGPCMMAAGSPFAIISVYSYLFCHKPRITLSLLELAVHCVWLASLLCLYGGALLYMRGLGFFNMVQVIRVGYTEMETMVVPWPSTQQDFRLAVGFQ